MYFTNSGQNFFIFGINFIGQSLKTASVLTNLGLSLFSIFTITKVNNAISRFFFKINSIIELFVFILPLSFGLNIIKIYLNDRHYDIGSSTQIDYYFLYDIRNSKNFYTKFNTLNGLFYIINHVLLICLTLFINLKISSFKKNLFNFISFRFFLFNGISLFLLRIPEIIFQCILAYHHIVKFGSNNIRFCYSSKLREDSICLNLVDSANFFSIISLCLNFVLLFVFSCQFRSAFFKLFRNFFD